MRFRCQFDYYPEPVNPNQYLQEFVVDILCFDDRDNEVTAGRLAIDHLSIERAINEGQDIYDICDADSSGWEHVFASLFEPSTQAEWRTDFEIDESIDSVLFMHKALFHPSLLSWQQFILDHAANLVGDASAFVTWKGLTNLTDAQLAELGFRAVAGADLRVRFNMYLNDYSASGEHPSVIDLIVPVDAGEQIESQWKSGRND